ncbi:hypothetical protein ACGF5M_00110 [Gemmatimonadota bacterium]
MRHISQFLLFVGLATLGKWIANLKGFAPPELSAWEIAALLHLVVVAFGTVDDEHLEFATPTFDCWIKRVVLGGCGVFLLLKLLAVFLETKYQTPQDGLEPLVTLAPNLQWLSQVLDGLTPYIIVMPLFFFLFVNVMAVLHVSRQVKKLGQTPARQVTYLRNLILFVDLPVVVPFSVLWVYLLVDPVFDATTYPLAMGLVGCCLLVVSNVAAGMYHEYWGES